MGNNLKVTDKKVEMNLAPGASVTVLGSKVKRLPYDHVKINQSTLANLSGDRDLSGGDFRVLCALLSVVEKGNDIVISQKAISEISGVDRAAVAKSLKKLVEKGLLEPMESIGRLNTYMLTPEHGYRGDNGRYYETKGRIIKKEVAQSCESYLAG